METALAAEDRAWTWSREGSTLRGAFEFSSGEQATFAHRSLEAGDYWEEWGIETLMSTSWSEAWTFASCEWADSGSYSSGAVDDGWGQTTTDGTHTVEVTGEEVCDLHGADFLLVVYDGESRLYDDASFARVVVVEGDGDGWDVSMGDCNTAATVIPRYIPAPTRWAETAWTRTVTATIPASPTPMATVLRITSTAILSIRRAPSRATACRTRMATCTGTTA